VIAVRQVKQHQHDNTVDSVEAIYQVDTFAAWNLSKGDRLYILLCVVQRNEQLGQYDNVFLLDQAGRIVLRPETTEYIAGSRTIDSHTKL